MFTRSQRGFTLIELIIVVVVISILTAFAVPNMITQGHRAKVYATNDTMYGVLMAAEKYASDHGGQYPASPEALAQYAMRQPRYANMRNAYNYQNVWLNLNRGQPGDITYVAILDATYAPVGYHIEGRGQLDWLPTALERRLRDATF